MLCTESTDVPKPQGYRRSETATTRNRTAAAWPQAAADGSRVLTAQGMPAQLRPKTGKPGPSSLLIKLRDKEEGQTLSTRSMASRLAGLEALRLCVAEMGGITWRKYVSFCRFHGVGQQSFCIKLSQGRCWRTEQHVSAGKNSLTLSMGEQREESLRKKKKIHSKQRFLNCYSNLHKQILG